MLIGSKVNCTEYSTAHIDSSGSHMACFYEDVEKKMPRVALVQKTPAKTFRVYLYKKYINMHSLGKTVAAAPRQIFSKYPSREKWRPLIHELWYQWLLRKKYNDQQVGLIY